MKAVADREPVCTYLDWDSGFFGRRIARVNPRRLNNAILQEALAWCDANRVDCLYFLADSDDPLTNRLAERNGFLQTDGRMTFERTLTENIVIPAASDVRSAREEELEELRSIARTGHQDTRFYFDEHFDRAKCDLLYETWIENSFRGFAQAVLIAESHGKPVGYVTCHMPAAHEAQIGIIGVADGRQGAGLGTKLVQQFLGWSIQQGARRATVVTQGRNIRAQRLYQRNGFVTARLQLWYHRWFKD